MKLKIKIRVGGVREFSAFVRTPANKAASDKGITLKRKFLKKFLLNFMNQWKELTKLIQNKLGTILIG